MTSLNWPRGIGLRSSNSTALTAASSGTVCRDWAWSVRMVTATINDSLRAGAVRACSSSIRRKLERLGTGVASEQFLGLIQREHKGR